MQLLLLLFPKRRSRNDRAPRGEREERIATSARQRRASGGSEREEIFQLEFRESVEEIGIESEKKRYYTGRRRETTRGTKREGLVELILLLLLLIFFLFDLFDEEKSVVIQSNTRQSLSC